MASGGDGNDDNREHRMPKNMKGLLRLCHDVSDPNNENNSSEEVISQMDPERQAFLEKAVSELTVNPVERMKSCIHVIKNTSDTDDGIDTKLQFLEELQQWCENLDCAIDFHKIGGFEIFSLLLNDDEAELRWMCLELIADLVQNNPYCQKAVLEYGLMPILLECLDKDSNSTVKTKALYAISCLARDDPDGQKLFVENDGFSVLMRAMQTDVEKLKIKSSFMLRSMCSIQPAYKDTLCDIGMVEQLIGLLIQDHNQQHEHITSALLSLVTEHSRSQQIARQPEFNLCNILKQRIESLKGQIEFQEESEYAQQILTIVNSEDNIQTVLR